jgi:hypothetical protein
MRVRVVRAFHPLVLHGSRIGDNRRKSIFCKYLERLDSL